MSNFCLLPTPDQKAFADYLGLQYGLEVKKQYLGVVTNPFPLNTNQYASGKVSEWDTPQTQLARLKLRDYLCRA